MNSHQRRQYPAASAGRQWLGCGKRAGRASMAALGVFCVLGSLNGCKRAEPTGTLAGTVSAVDPVTRQARRVRSGTVTFYHPLSKRQVQADIHSDGQYQAANVPLGEHIVAVASPRLEVPDPEVDGLNRHKAFDPHLWFPIAALYCLPDRSPLRVTVQQGAQTYDIKLDSAWTPPQTRVHQPASSYANNSERADPLSAPEH